jgi:hypothetical protein
MEKTASNLLAFLPADLARVATNRSPGRVGAGNAWGAWFRASVIEGAPLAGHRPPADWADNQQ